jgi:hypothetical protein
MLGFANAVSEAFASTYAEVRPAWEPSAGHGQVVAAMRQILGGPPLRRPQRSWVSARDVQP